MRWDEVAEEGVKIGGVIKKLSGAEAERVARIEDSVATVASHTAAMARRK